MTPSEFIDMVRTMKSLKNDYALCEAIQIAPPELCRIRKAVKPFGPLNILRFHAYTGIPLPELCAMVKDHIPVVVAKMEFPS